MTECVILLLLGVVTGFIAGFTIWFDVVRYWERRAKLAEESIKRLDDFLKDG